MSPWVVTVLDGVLTGLALYGLVRLRMHFGPVAAERWGVWGRRAVWILLITSMVIVAELDLIWLRNWLERNEVAGPLWRYEALFALLLLIVGLGLVCGRIFRRRRHQREIESDRTD